MTPTGVIADPSDAPRAGGTELAQVLNSGTVNGAIVTAVVVLAAVRTISGVPAEVLEAALRVHSLLTYTPVIPKERLMIVGGLGDRLAPRSRACSCGSTGGARSCAGSPEATSSTSAAARTCRPCGRSSTRSRGPGPGGGCRHE